MTLIMSLIYYLLFIIKHIIGFCFQMFLCDLLCQTSQGFLKIFLISVVF